MNPWRRVTMDLEHTDTLTPEIFRYDSLKDQSSDLRLIEILPGKTTDIIMCRMNTYSSHQHPSYEALSYAWGDDANKKSIGLHYYLHSGSHGSRGGIFNVTANLYSALLNLRKCRTGQPVDQRMLIWIDALCIDQQNLEERNVQVQRMKEIYQKAKKVVIYLGDYDEFSDRRLHFAPEIWGIDGLEYGSYALTLAAFTIATYLSSLSTVANDEETAHMLAESSQRDRPGNPLANIRGWAHLSRLFNRPWFERLWIIQELDVSPAAIALCGGIAVPWSAIEDTAAFILRPHAATPPDILRFFPLMGAHRVTQVALSTVLDVDKRNLLTILRHTQGASCSDPRDKLYAILGVSEDTHDVSIDYSKSFESVYRHWAILRILRTKSLDVLSACADSSQTGELPSWVPDLRRPWAHDRALWRTTYGSNQQEARIDPRLNMHMLPISSSWRLEDLFQGDHLQLSIDGSLIGRISSLSELGDAVTNLEDPTALTSRLDNIVTDWEEWYAQYQTVEPDRSISTRYGTTPHYPFRSTLLRKSWSTPDLNKLTIAYEMWRRELGPRPSRYNSDPIAAQAMLRSFEATLFSLVHGCQMFVLDNLKLGVVAGNCHCQPGDEVYLLRGGSTPFILRRNDSGHTLITPCFLDGYMEGHLRSYFSSRIGAADLEKVVLV